MSIDPSHGTSFRLPPDGRATEVDFGGFGDGTSVSGTGPSVWGEDGFTFSDLVDLVNPLQHIPVVSTIYRALTGDDIAPAARILGGSVLGGPLGFAASVVNVAIEDATDRDIGGHVWAWLNGEDTAPGQSAPTAVASNAKPSSSHADVEPMMLAFAPERGQRPGSGTGAASGAEPGHAISPEPAHTAHAPAANAILMAGDQPVVVPPNALFEALPLPPGGALGASAGGETVNLAKRSLEDYSARELAEHLRLYMLSRGLDTGSHEDL